MGTTGMADVLTCDICVIGAGSGGLTAAAGAALMGARTVLVEKGAMGGDCLNTGCVPSKALLAAAGAARQHRRTAGFGVGYGPPAIDFAGVHAHVKAAIERIAPHDSQERFESLGVTVLREAARFTGRREIVAGDRRVRARRFVIATGSRPAIPSIPGLEALEVWTNETIFDLTVRPEHLAVIGGGPVGLELAQAFARLGSQVTVIEAERCLQKEDHALLEPLWAALDEDGVSILAPARIERAERDGKAMTLTVAGPDGPKTLAPSHVLAATGRTPVTEGLDLSAAGVERKDGAIRVDRRMRTTNRRIYAVGDCTGGPQFTHMAGYEAGIVLRNALFRLPARADYDRTVRVTYTDPQVAHLGLTEAQARQRHGQGIDVLEEDFAENDRAICEGERSGSIKVVSRRGRPLGVTIVHRHADELIQPWCLALKANLKLSALAGTIFPYPTLGEVNKKVAGSFYTDKLFGDRVKTIVRLLQRL